MLKKNVTLQRDLSKNENKRENLRMKRKKKSHHNLHKTEEIDKTENRRN